MYAALTFKRIIDLGPLIDGAGFGSESKAVGVTPPPPPILYHKEGSDSSPVLLGDKLKN